jgi:hypothetical protein
MAMTAKSEARSLTLRQQKGRVVNAVAELLRKRLSVPNIYLEPSSPYISANVLAVDRAGSGDLHAVEIWLRADFSKPVPATLDPSGWKRVLIGMTKKKIEEELGSLSTHYRYLAIPHESWDLLAGDLGSQLYSRDGIGRIGIIAITDQGEEPPRAEIVIAPERFRVDAAKLSKIEKNLINNKKVRPDIEVRI